MAEYDKIAKQYVQSINSPFRKFVLFPSLLYYLGNIKNKKVLDLGCGEGHLTRTIKRKSKATVVGVDISKEMIKLAKKEERKRPLGIKYYVFDVLKMPKLDNFDLIVAVLLLHYSKTKSELFKMCKNIYKNLKKDGKFIAITKDPFHPLQLYSKYRFTATAKAPLKEGDAVTITLFNKGQKLCSFKNYFWKKETYEEILRKAGFKTIKWHKLFVSKEGIKKFGKKFWKDFKPSTIIIECTK